MGVFLEVGCFSLTDSYLTYVDYKKAFKYLCYIGSIEKLTNLMEVTK